MPRNIVLCCDGTRNEFGAENTNVVKLYMALRHDTPEQAAYYHPGLGSMGAPGALTAFTRAWTAAFGLAFGYGLSQHLADLYGFLMQQYEPGDRLFVIGFSRGAYTARAFCSLLHAFGLIRCQDTVLIPYAIRLLKRFGRSENRHVIAKFHDTFSSTYLKPHFVGVWDTVSSVGTLYDPLKLPYSSWNPDIAIGRHAIAIDERRAFYRQNLWSPDQGQDIRQVWFAGAHCDVGGGYPEEDSGLSKLALQWMLAEARSAGLLLDPAKVDFVLGRAGGGMAPPDPAAMLHDSMKGWGWAEWIPRRRFDAQTRQTHWFLPRGHRRTIRSGSLIHESVLVRMKAVPGYRPPLPDKYEIEPLGSV